MTNFQFTLNWKTLNNLKVTELINKLSLTFLTQINVLKESCGATW